MRTFKFTLLKILVICLTLFFLNLTIISNYPFASAASLTNDNLRPELNQYWKIENRDLDNGWVFQYTLEVVEEKNIMIANNKTPILVIEGDGIIVEWDPTVKEELRTDYNKVQVKKEIRKDNLELITETLNISYGYSDNITYPYKYFINTYTTYNIIELTKPDIITVGTSWTKKVLRTETVEYKRPDEPVRKDTHPTELINSTIECQKIAPVTVPAGSFDTFKVVEQQFVISAFPDTTIFYYYSIKANNIVLRERWNPSSETVEIEKVLKYGTKEVDNGQNNNDSDDGDTSWLDLEDRNVQIMLGITGIVIICIIIGILISRKRKKDVKK